MKCLVSLEARGMKYKVNFAQRKIKIRRVFARRLGRYGQVRYLFNEYVRYRYRKYGRLSNTINI